MDQRIESCLRRNGLEHYSDLFREQRIDTDVLAELDDHALAAFGVPWADRRRLLKAVAEVHDRSTELSSNGPAGTSLDASRRLVTVLFADISDFSGLSTRLGSERTRDLLNDYFRDVFDIVVRFGGTLQNPDGDCAIAFFGAPIAHTSDPERAVRAACAIQDEMARLGATWELNLTAHIGIASGIVVAGETGSRRRRVFTVIGESVNLAKRLESHAQRGEILISEAVFRAVEHMARCTSRGAIEVKGFSEPVTTWSVEAITAADHTERKTPVIGREGELRQIEAILKSSVETESGCCIVVRGEPGIGKTRLADTASALALPLGYRATSGLVLDFGVERGGDALSKILQALISRLGDGQSDFLSQIPEELLVFLNEVQARPQTDAYQSLLDAMDVDTREMGMRKLISFVVGVAAFDMPLLIVVEDIHWADEATLARLMHLASAIAELPVVLFMTSRLEGATMQTGWGGAINGCPVTMIDLPSLRHRDSEQLVSLLVANSENDIEQLVARGGGNPLFLEQLASVAHHDRGNLPDSVQGVVTAQTDRLDSRDRNVIQAASVLGQRFSVDAVRALTDSPGLNFDLLRLQQLIRREGPELIFAHALFREAIYAGMLTPERTRLHRAAADWFSGKDLALVAEHLDLAGDPAACQTYADAARDEQARFYFTHALKLAARGAELATDPDDSYQLHHLTATILGALERREEAAEEYELALSAAGTDAQRCEALIGQAISMFRLDRFNEAETVLDRAEAQTSATQFLGVITQVYRYRAAIAFARGDVQLSLAHSQKALNAATKGEIPRLEAEALSCKGDAELALCRYQSAHESFSRCIEICRAQDLRRYAVVNLKMLGDIQIYQGELSQARNTMESVIAEAIGIGASRAEMLANGMIAYIEILANNIPKALDHIAAERRIIEEIDAPRFLLNASCLAAMAERALGNQDNALRALSEAESMVHELEVVWLLPWVLGERALTITNLDLRKECLDEGERLLRSGAGVYALPEFYRPAIEASIDTGDWHRVKRYANEFEYSNREEPAGLIQFIVARARTLAEAAESKPDYDRIRRLRWEAEAMGFLEAIPRLDAALSGENK